MKRLTINVNDVKRIKEKKEDVADEDAAAAGPRVQSH